MASTYEVATGAIALSASATKSLWLVTPATIDFEITEISISFNGSTPQTGIEVDIYRVASGTAQAGTTYTPGYGNTEDGTAATSTVLTNLTTEPTTITVLKNWYISPACGLLIIQYPLGREMKGTKRSAWPIGLRCITPSGVSPSALAGCEFEE